MNRLEAVIVCVDYADYLEETLPFLLPHVDDLVVVTTPEDGRTRKACAPARRALPADPLLLSRGRGLQQGPGDQLRAGEPQAGRLGAPYRRGHRAAAAHAVPARQHGPRRRASSTGATGSIASAGPRGTISRQTPRSNTSGDCLIKPPRRWPLGARIAHMEYGGYCPIGFFQLWSRPRFGRHPLPPGVPGDGRAFRRAPCHPVGPRGSLPHPRIDLRPPGDEGQGRRPPDGAELGRPDDSRSSRRDEKPYRIATARPGGVHAAGHATYSSVNS